VQPTEAFGTGHRRALEDLVDSTRLTPTIDQRYGGKVVVEVHPAPATGV
jgi:hypothetical protein